MDLGNLVLLAVVILVIVLAFRVFGGQGGMDMFRRARRVLSSEKPVPALRQPTLDDLRPGDAVSFWDGTDDVVESVVQAREELGGRASTWRWVVLSSGHVLEVAADNNALYDRSTVLQQGSEPFYALAAEPEHGGALKTFEARVRDQSIAREPVTLTLEGAQWSVESTGTFMATFAGPPPTQDVWRDISENPADNVYFELHGDDQTSALGVWTTHILLLQGRHLEASDIQALYPGAEERTA